MSREPTAPFPADLGATLHQLRDTAVQIARLVGGVGVRLDALSLELARDLGAASRDARAFATTARDRAAMLRRATPRAARLARACTWVFAHHRWLRLQAAARGHDGLTADDHRELARRVTAVAAELRGGIAKLGQLASCRPDLIGAIWAGELAALQDDVPPVASAGLRARVERELGRPIDAMFASFDDVPLAAASLAQVHAATLHDGTRVVVKIQVPGVEDAVEGDLAALRVIAGTLGELPGVDLPSLAGELTRALAAELDYVAEAAALSAFVSSAILPRVVPEASAARVLTMTRIDGTPLIPALDAMAADDRDRVLGELVEELAAQILVRGRVHADPHPGNVLVTPAGELALVDFGCTLELGPAERAGYARLVLAIAADDRTAAATALAALGFTADDPAQLVALAASIIGALRPGAAVDEVDWEATVATQLAAARRLGGLGVPRSFVLLGRVLATVAGLLATYRPRIALHARIAGHLARAIA